MTRHNTNRLAMSCAAVLGLALVMAPTLAFAHGRHSGPRRYEPRVYAPRYDAYHYDAYRPVYPPSHGYRSHHGRFAVPHRIHGVKIVKKYKPYYYGRHYHRGHRHHHDIYRFPVYGYGRVDYRPFAYCKGAYFSVGAFTPGGVHFGFGFGY